MDWVLGVIAWVLGVIASIVVAYITALLTARNEEKRLREELKLEYSAEKAIIELLGNRGWELRSFKTIKHHIRGFDDDELRRLLVRSGAIAFQQKPEDRDMNDAHRGDSDKLERWGLLEKNRDRLARATS